MNDEHTDNQRETKTPSFTHVTHVTHYRVAEYKKMTNNMLVKSIWRPTLIQEYKQKKISSIVCKQRLWYAFSSPIMNNEDVCEQWQIKIGRRKNLGKLPTAGRSIDLTHLCQMDSSTLTLWTYMYIGVVWLVSIITMFWRSFWTWYKQCRSWSDATFCGVWSGSTLFVNVHFMGG